MCQGLVVLIAEHQNTAQQADKKQRTYFEASADRLSPLQLSAIRDRHGNTPSQRDQDATDGTKNRAQNHKDFGRSCQPGLLGARGAEYT